jgi:hypothetical protein
MTSTLSERISVSTETLEAVSAVEAPTATPTPVENPADFTEVHGTRVDLLENAVKLHLSNGTTRIVSYSDFSQTLLTFLDKAQESKVATLRLLPSNVYAIEEGVSHLNLGFYFPETIQNVNFLGDIERRVVPNIILTVYLTRGAGDKKFDFKFRDARYYCTNLPLARLPREIVSKTGPSISILPFTNVYSEANLCMGNNSIISDFLNNDLRATSWYHDMLWASPFNNDLGVRALKESSKYRDSNSSWYKHLAKLAKDGKGFPYEEVRNMTQS